VSHWRFQVKNISNAIRNLHVWDVAICGAVIVAGFAVACKAIADINPFWGMLAMVLGASMLFCVIAEEIDHQKPAKARSILDLPRNRRMS